MQRLFETTVVRRECADGMSKTEAYPGPSIHSAQDRLRCKGIGIGLHLAASVDCFYISLKGLRRCLLSSDATSDCTLLTNPQASTRDDPCPGLTKIGFLAAFPADLLAAQLVVIKSTPVNASVLPAVCGGKQRSVSQTLLVFFAPELSWPRWGPGRSRPDR